MTKKALQSTAEDGKSSSADPVVDMELSDIGATLILTLNMNDIWKVIIILFSSILFPFKE